MRRVALVTLLAAGALACATPAALPERGPIAAPRRIAPIVPDALDQAAADLALDYVAQHPPEGLEFDPGAFRDLVDSGSRVYEMVAARDGAPEKIEAARRLEAFLAFALSIDRDRFTP